MPRLFICTLLLLIAEFAPVPCLAEDEIPAVAGLNPIAGSAAQPASFLQADPPPETPSAMPTAPAYQPLIQPGSPFSGPFLDRPKLTGNWMGLRDDLLANGVTFDISSTSFYQGVAAGGINQNFQFSGRDDYYMNVDGEKAGLWKGLYLNLHGETRYGNTVNGNTGALMPVNVGMLFPTPTGNVTALTALKATQFVSENFLVFGGKINILDEWKQPYAGGRGVDAFMNTNLAFPVALARTVPYSSLGAGFAVLQDLYPIFSFMVLDTHNTPTTTGFESFLTNGVTMLAKVDIPVTFYDLPGHQGGGATYSTGTYNNLAPTPYFSPNFGPGLMFGSTAGSWSAFYMADQAFYVDPSNPNRSWGLFKTFGMADNGPSPIQWSVAFGLGGTSPIMSRPQDTFGAGYSFVGYTTPVQDIAPHVVPIHSDQAVEAFYNVAVTPWFRLTPDMQVLLPARERTASGSEINTALVLGLRAKIDF